MTEDRKNKIKLEDKITNWVSTNLFYSFMILVLIIFIVLLSVFGITALIYKDKTILNPNEIGDTIGGLTAPIIGLFSAFLVYIAFRAQIKANEELSKTNKLNEFIELEKSTLIELDNLTLTPNNIDKDPILKGINAILHFKNRFKIIDLSLWGIQTNQIQFTSDNKYYYKYFTQNYLDYSKNTLTTLEIINKSNIDYNYKAMFIHRIYNSSTSFVNAVNDEEIYNQFNIYNNQYQLDSNSANYNEIKYFLKTISQINNEIQSIKNKYNNQHDILTTRHQ